jgi:signal peptidase I
MAKFTRFLLWTVGILAVVAVILRIALFESWVVPEDDPWLSASLEPTLRGGDAILLLVRGEPGFGDLVRCTDPDDPSGHVMGRIVGVEHDKVDVQGARLSINRTAYNATEACEQRELTVEHPDTGAEVELQCGRVDLGGTWHFRASGGKPTPSDNRKLTVGPGKVFLLSDNRLFHLDSRDYGTVELETCSGRVVYRFWGKDGWSDSSRRFDMIR